MADDTAQKFKTLDECKTAIDEAVTAHIAAAKAFDAEIDRICKASKELDEDCVVALCGVAINRMQKQL